MPENPVDELDKHDMTPDRAMEIVTRIKGPTGIAAAKKEIIQQVENRKIMLVKLQAQIEAYQAFGRTLEALETVWGISVPADKPLPELQQSVAGPSASDEAAKQFQNEVKKRVVEGKCSFKSPSVEGGGWCARLLKSKLEKQHGYCSIHLHHLGIVKDDEPEEPVAQKKVRSSKKGDQP
jgi:hypothetical protein